jgi:hypothetical protein
MTLSGSVAVGVPMTDAHLRVLDASGNIVVQDVVVAADGAYPPVTLTGPAPYRIEVCGYNGPNYDCEFSVAQGPGTANITPITTAIVLLASGSDPSSVMSGPASGLDSTAVGDAQTQLQTGLADVLASAGVAADLDFIGGNLTAGSRAGYDRILDSVGVSTGVDTQPFVQITPRLGSGNLYLESGSAPLGQITSDAGSDTLPLASLDTLFQNMTAALANADACADPVHGIATQLASSVRMSMGDTPNSGPPAVGAALCQFFASGDNGTAMWGSRLLSPTLGRCDLTGQAARCHVSFVLQSPSGDVENVGDGMAVALEGGAWKFLGSYDPIEIHANATAQRSRRIDGDTPVDSYYRAISFQVPALAGMSCAQISQTDALGNVVTIAWYKRHDNTQRNLSLWVTANTNERSLDPAVGMTRNADDTWMGLPQGEEGDAVVRNFYRGGRTVSIALFSDLTCTTPFTVAGQGSFDVDVLGVPPVWSAMATMPWADLTDAAATALRTLALDANATGSYAAAWTIAHGRLGVDEMTFCADMQCGAGSPGRIGEMRFAPGGSSATVSLQNGPTPLAADGFKELALYGKTGDGMMVESNILSCPASPAGQMCQ